MDSTSSKPQKSSFWIWTTLWLTAFIDSGIIFSVFVYTLRYLPADTSIFIRTISILGFLLLSLWLGAYFAVKYVLKRSILPKTDATKLATLAVIVPILFWLIRFGLGTLDILGVLMAVITVSVIFYSIKKMIIIKGD